MKTYGVNIPEKELQESIASRRGYVQDALYYRRKGNRQGKLASLNCARCERLKQMFFLGDPPF